MFAAAVDGVQILVVPQVRDDVDLCGFQGSVQQIMHSVLEHIVGRVRVLQTTPSLVQEQAAEKRKSY